MEQTNLNVSPIFDDFDETKNFHRILFNAGKSVQARELTQAQTILQSQIERLGKHLFDEGSMVVPGGIKAIESQDVIKLTLNNGSLFTDFSTESDIYVKNATTGMIFKISKIFDAVGTDPISLFVDLVTPGSGQEKKFLVNDQITIFTYNVNGTQRNLSLGVVTATAKGQWVKVQSGVYFVRGMFVRTDDQEFVVSKYTTDTTLKVGFKAVETIVTSADDITLFSNANGFPNQNSDGASRLKVTLELVGLAIGATDKDFIEIARFDGGSLSSQVDYTTYSIIEQAIAQRTYETNGDYVVNNFGLDVKEHLNNGTNNGTYLLAAGGDETKLVAAVRPGVGYVRGFRVENIGIQNVPFDKARDFATLNNASYVADYGQYFLVDNVKSLPDVDIKKTINLLDSANVTVGTARVRAMRKDGTSYRVYVFDITMNAGKVVNDISKIKYTDASSLFTADLALPGLYESNKGSLVFQLPVSAVKSLSQFGTDTSYTVQRSFTLTTNSSGVVSAALNANEFFAAIDSNYMVALTGSASAGTQFDPTTAITLGGSIFGTNMTIDLGVGQANATIKVIAPVIKTVTTQKSKTLLTVVDEVIAFPTTNRQKFTKADIYDVISVKDNTTGDDITSLFTFDNGQRDSWYESGKLVVADSTPIIRTVKVTYRYFAHSAGDYFTVDSYVGLTRDQVPSYNGSNLSDFIDFRPLKDSNDNFTSATVFGEILKPGDAVRADVTYYLPRTDLIVVDKDGVFKDVRGIPSLTPATPETPADTMKLYELYIPAFTLNPSDVTVKTVDNKRYTMRDIGKLENRIANIEYYTALTALETNTNKTEVLDPTTGNNRFKNGFAVDGFTDFRLADVLSPEWSASLDLDNNKLKPSFVQNGVAFSVSTMTNASKPGSVFMKSYTESKVVDQPYATMTINVNPYAVFTWMGNIALSPDRDYWKDTIYAAPVIINNTIDYRGGAVEGVFWGDWVKTTYDELGGHKAWAQHQYKQTQYQTTFQEQTYSNSTSDVVATQVIPYMRPIEIAFKCQGFRPFTRIYPFWDGVNVSQYCRPTAGVNGDAIITDAAGQASGLYDIPTGTFKTGKSVFRFSDDVNDSLDPNLLTTWGTTTFSSGGITETDQITTTNTEVLTATTNATGAVNFQDPIAQTFIVPLDGGCFATKFDIFFSTKARDIPVTLQLRTAITGLPTSDILGSVTLNPSDVNVSLDGSVATSFVFPDPVYLQQGLEYAIVLVANTQEYNVYIAEQGQNIIGANMALSKQAYMGVFLTSSNGSTWNPQQNRDMKFSVYRAMFDVGTVGQVVLNSLAPAARPLSSNALNSTSGSNNVVVKQNSHGLKAGDTVTIAGAVAGNGLLDAGLNGTKTVLATTVDTFTYQATSAANATGALGGDAMTVVGNYPFNLIVNNLAAFAPNGTTVSWEYQYKSQTTRVPSGWIALNPKTTTTLPSEGVAIAAGDVQLRATLSTTKDNLSPMIESNGHTMVLVTPRVDATSKIFNYVSQNVLFNNATTTAKFYVGARLPGSSGMKFYVKVIETSDQDVANTVWTELIPVAPVSNSDNYLEYEYQLDGNFIGYKLKVELTGSRDNYPDLSDVRSLAFA